MKKLTGLMVIAAFSSITVFAQDPAAYKKPQPLAMYDSIPNPSDTTKKHKNWDKDKMPKEKQRKNWPDTMGRADTLRRNE